MYAYEITLPPQTMVQWKMTNDMPVKKTSVLDGSMFHHDTTK